MADHEFRVNSPQTQRFLPKVTRRFSQSSWLGVRIWRQQGPSSDRASRIALVRRVMSFVARTTAAKKLLSCWVCCCITDWAMEHCHCLAMKGKVDPPCLDIFWTFPTAEPLLIDSCMLVFGSYFRRSMPKTRWMNLKKSSVKLVVRDSK